MAVTYDTQIPGVGTYGQAVTQANLAYSNALARLNKQRADTFSQFGYAANIDPTSGTVAGLHVDPNARFGAFQQMLAQGNTAGLSARDSLIDRHISGRGGLGAQTEEQLHNDFGQASSQLGQSLSSAISGFQDQQNQAAYDKNAALYTAEQQAIDAAAHNPADEGGGAPPAGGPSVDQRTIFGAPGTEPVDSGILAAARNKVSGPSIDRRTIFGAPGTAPVDSAIVAAARRAKAKSKPSKTKTTTLQKGRVTS